jgi:hypothetical protein
MQQKTKRATSPNFRANNEIAARFKNAQDLVVVVYYTVFGILDLRGNQPAHHLKSPPTVHS